MAARHAMKFVLLSLLALAGVHAAEPNSFAELRQLFSAPPPAYSTAPFFVWNGEVMEKDIDKMLADYKAQGINAFFIHPRPGMVTPYLSDRWFELVRYTVAQSKKLGMICWLYDENSYPSGFAGGHVPADMPESWNAGQGLVPRKLDGMSAEARAKCVVESGGMCFELAFYDKRAWHGGFSYVDLLKPGVTQKFIDVTMRGYQRTLAGDLGKSVPGIFTDEPNIIAPNRNAMRWTPDLFEQFEKRWGYDLRPHLMSLFENTGDWQRIRHNYYALLLDLFIERWSKPWFDYTEKKGIIWTGHYWEHGWPSPVHGPDNMAMYAWHHVPGIDMLFNQFAEGVNAQFGNVRSVRELASVANQMGRRRTLSETYGGAGWELRFEDMKRLGDWQYALGVNLMNQHLSHGTLMGARKYDYPQSFTYHTPWWPKYRSQAEYFARLSLALSTGEQVNKILVLEPTTSAWMYAAIPKADARMMEIGEGFQQFLNKLEAMQVEYDLGSENILKTHAKIAGTRLVVGKRAYELVVLPPGTENIDSSTLRLLRDYVRAGGRLISAGKGPDRVDGAPSAELRDVAAKWTTVNEAASLANRSFEQVTGKLFHQRRMLADGQLMFFVNSSLEEDASATVVSPGGSATELDPATGHMRPFPVDSGRIRVSLPPAGSLLLAITNSAATKQQMKSAEPAVRVAPAVPMMAKRLSANSLRIDYCDLTLGGTTEKDIYFYKAQETVFKHFGFSGNPWNTAVQYKTSVLDKNTFPADSTFAAAFRFDIAPGVERRGLNAVVERPELWSVSVNGKPVEAEKGAWWLDVRFGVYPIGGLVRDGANEVIIRANRMSVHHELEPVFITGDFGVEPQGRGFRIVPARTLATGDWKTQSLPTYPDRVAYTAAFELKRGVPAAVQLGKWNGTVAEVIINGKSAGLIYTKPYRLDITPNVSDGSNRIDVVVYGSLKNLLGPHHGKINRGLVSPQSFRSAPEHMPAGSSYDLDSYGLFEDFTVFTGSVH